MQTIKSQIEMYGYQWGIAFIEETSEDVSIYLTSIQDENKFPLAIEVEVENTYYLLLKKWVDSAAANKIQAINYQIVLCEREKYDIIGRIRTYEQWIKRGYNLTAIAYNKDGSFVFHYRSVNFGDEVNNITVLDLGKFCKLKCIEQRPPEIDIGSKGILPFQTLVFEIVL